MKENICGEKNKMKEGFCKVLWSYVRMVLKEDIKG